MRKPVPPILWTNICNEIVLLTQFCIIALIGKFVGDLSPKIRMNCRFVLHQNISFSRICGERNFLKVSAVVLHIIRSGLQIRKSYIFNCVITGGKSNFPAKSFLPGHTTVKIECFPLRQIGTISQNISFVLLGIKSVRVIVKHSNIKVRQGLVPVPCRQCQGFIGAQVGVGRGVAGLDIGVGAVIRVLGQGGIALNQDHIAAVCGHRARGQQTDPQARSQRKRHDPFPALRQLLFHILVLPSLKYGNSVQRSAPGCHWLSFFPAGTASYFLSTSTQGYFNSSIAQLYRKFKISPVRFFCYKFMFFYTSATYSVL